jgi:hypothetical protein
MAFTPFHAGVGTAQDATATQAALARGAGTGASDYSLSKAATSQASFTFQMCLIVL